MNYISFLRSRRSNSLGVPGALFAAGQLPTPLARRRFDASGPVDSGILANTWSVTRSLGVSVPDPTIWQRIDDLNSEYVQVLDLAGGWYQHQMLVPSGTTEVWIRFDFQLLERAAGDDRTRIIGIASSSGLDLGVYWNDGQIELRDEIAGTSTFGGTTDVSTTWRQLKVRIVADSGSGDGVLEAYLSDPVTPDVSMSTHSSPLAERTILYGLGSVGSDHRMSLASLELWDVDPHPNVPALSTNWAAAAPFAEVVDPLSAISVTPDPMGAQDGATAGTVIGTLGRTGGRGDGTWSLTGDLATVATINGTSVELTTAVDTATHDGTTGTIGYSGDSASGTASNITTSLTVASATTSLTLSTPAGGSTVSGTLDTSQPFQSLFMPPPVTPAFQTITLHNSSAPACNPDIPVLERGYCGTRTRIGLEAIAQASDAAIIHVTTLDGGSGVGTLRWAAETTSDNDGNDISGKPVIVVFDVSGHIVLDGACRFRQNNRWFAGQTAPQSSSGSGSIFVHRWVGGRKVEGSNIIIDHLRFIDGRDRAGGGGALDITRDGSPQRSVMLRNCSFWWGVDETVAFAPGWDGGRQDQMSVIDCMFPEPTWFTGSDPRGKPLFHKYGAHRFEYRGMFVPGYKIRAPGCKFYMSASVCNIVGYEGSVPPVYLMKQPPWWGGTIGDRPDLEPAGFWFFHSGNWVIGGPRYDADADMRDLAVALVPNGGGYDRSIWFVTHTISGNSDSFSKRVNGSVVPVAINFAREGHTFYDAYTEPQLWPYRAPFPNEDTVANVVNHCGPWPGDRHAGEQRIIQTFQDGGSLVYTFSGERQAPEDHPDGQMASASRTPGSNLPANPFDTDTNGLTVIENWLEQQHIAVGGAPYEDFGKRLRFPWGGIVTVETNGTVTFEPEDMAAGREGVIEVTRADGSTVTVTCRAV